MQRALASVPTVPSNLCPPLCSLHRTSIVNVGSDLTLVQVRRGLATTHAPPSVSAAIDAADRMPVRRDTHARSRFQRHTSVSAHVFTARQAAIRGLGRNFGLRETIQRSADPDVRPPLADTTSGLSVSVARLWNFVKAPIHSALLSLAYGSCVCLDKRHGIAVPGTCGLSALPILYFALSCATYRRISASPADVDHLSPVWASLACPRRATPCATTGRSSGCWTGSGWLTRRACTAWRIGPVALSRRA